MGGVESHGFMEAGARGAEKACRKAVPETAVTVARLQEESDDLWAIDSGPYNFPGLEEFGMNRIPTDPRPMTSILVWREKGAPLQNRLNHISPLNNHWSPD